MRHHERCLKKDAGPQRKNKKPEKQVEKDCLKWMRENGFDVDIIEASGERNEFGAIAVKSGYSDCSGNDSFGRAVYVEFKAPGRAVFSSVRPGQIKFLKRKIETNCFAVVVDSAKVLENYYRAWINVGMTRGRDGAREYLKDIFPKERVNQDDSDLF